MPNPLRFIPPEGCLVEVTCTTIQRRLLLTPRHRLREITIGALARAKAKQEKPLQIVAFSFLSSHFHLLLWVPDAQTLAGFMCHFNSKMGKEIKRLAHWGEKIWGRRYRAILVSEEPLVQEERLEYVLANGTKEGLVESPLDWPGAHSARALLSGEPMVGVWYDRTGEYRASRRKSPLKPEEFAEEEILTLDPLPCWRDLSPEQRQERAAAVVARIVEKAQAEREKTGMQPLGPAAIQAQHPHTRPDRIKKSPAPLFHAWSKKAYRELYEAYGHFVAAFRAAAEKLRMGDRTAVFPEGSFPPALPFVRPPLLAAVG
jgi:REP element-mobilizing transposase RayT